MRKRRQQRPQGSLIERSPGHWAFVVSRVDPATGKRRRVWHSFEAKNKSEAENKRTEILETIRVGIYQEPSKVTVAQYLDGWLADIKARVAPRTHERYAEICRKNIVPLLGAVRLLELRTPQIRKAWTTALESGHRRTRRALSARTVHHMHTVFKNALGQAVSDGLLAHNPAAKKGVAPKPDRPDLHTYDIAQTAELLETIRETPWFVPVMIAVLCGLRRGEICALQWRHVDLATGHLSIARSAEQTRQGVRYKQPKSGKGRTVALAASVVEELRQHRLQQAQDLLRLGVRLNDDTFVCAQADGSPLRPNSLTIAWSRLAAAGTLPRIRFHDLRHACATHMLKLGVHPKVASERLGHGRVDITLDLYSKVIPGMQEEAASKVDDALQAALASRKNRVG